MDPNSHQYLRFALELFYFASGVILAVVGVIALYQIMLAKRSIKTANDNLKLAAEALETARSDIELRSKREAVTLAADKCAEFAEHTLDKCNERFKAISDAGVSVEIWPLENTRFDKSSIKDWAAADRWEERLRVAERRDQAAEILNLLESFAMYFAKGAADEQVAYSAVGALFRDFVNRLAPHLILLRIKETDIVSGPFQNVVTLYEVWDSRSRKQELETNAMRISSELSRIHTSDITPIGTPQR
jgi:hypothetical protein